MSRTTQHLINYRENAAVASNRKIYEPRFTAEPTKLVTYATRSQTRDALQGADPRAITAFCYFKHIIVGFILCYKYSVLSTYIYSFAFQADINPQLPRLNTRPTDHPAHVLVPGTLDHVSDKVCS